MDHGRQGRRYVTERDADGISLVRKRKREKEGGRERERWKYMETKQKRCTLKGSAFDPLLNHIHR